MLLIPGKNKPTKDHVIYQFLLKVLRYCLPLIIMASRWIGCCNDGGASWKGADDASFGQAYALLLHRLKQSLVLISHFIKFINAANSLQTGTSHLD